MSEGVEGLLGSQAARAQTRRSEITGRGRAGGFLASKWRLLLFCVAAVLLVLALMPRLGQQGTSAQTTQPASATPAPTTDPSRATALPATGRGATAQVQPSPTPDTIRPLSGPVASRLTANGPAPVRKAGSPDPQPSTDSFVVVDGDSGAVLFEENAHNPVAMASLTKIMTAIVGIEHGNLADFPKIDVDAREFADSTVMGLEPRFNVTFEDLLYGLMLPSGNDAAVAIAHYVAGDEKNFVRLMNEKAEWLGLHSTHFANPHGLDASDHYSSPYDMAAMGRYAMQYPVFRQLAAAKTYDIRRSNIAYTLQNLNPILWSYPGADGVKIGFTDNAGRSIVASATRNGHRVFVAFMRSKAGLAPDSAHLLDWAFAYHIWPN